MTQQEMMTVSVAARRAGDGSGRSVRIKAGLTVREMARRVDVAEATMSRWETGKRTPRGPAAMRWVLMLDDMEARQRTNA